MTREPHDELALVDQRLWVVVRRTGLAAYDFDFSSCFAIRHPAHVPDPVVAVARLGAVEDLEAEFALWQRRGVTFINNPEDARLADDLSKWYPSLADLTPRSVVFDRLPDACDVEAAIGWPVFLKGVRQTSRHDASLAIARSAADYARLSARWYDNPILASQRVAARELAQLRVVQPAERPDELPRAFEFRTFWWRGEFVAAGPYWTNAGEYRWSDAERRSALAVAGEAARRLNVGFLCVDVAQTTEGKWIVIEVNDGQRSGYAGVPRIALWRAVIDAIDRSPL